MSGKPRLRCIDCKIHDKERTFATVSGYSSHLERYHKVKVGDAVNLVGKPDLMKPKHTDFDHSERCTTEECFD